MRNSAKGLPIQVEEVLPAKRALAQLHQDQISDDGHLTNGLARLLTLLSLCASDRQKRDKGKGQSERNGFTSGHAHPRHNMSLTCTAGRMLREAVQRSLKEGRGMPSC